MSQAKSALAMQKATETVQQKMKKHKADVSETLFLNPIMPLSIGPVHFHFKGCWVVVFIFIQILI